MRTMLMGGLLLVTGTMLAGCGPKSADHGNTQAAAAAGGGASGSWDAEHACTLLDKDVVATTLGTKVTAADITESSQRSSESAGRSTCRYTLSDGGHLDLVARQSPIPDNTPDAIKRARDAITELGAPVEDVGGVGKAAFWVPSLHQLVVFAGADRYFYLKLPEGFGGKDKAYALALAGRLA